MHGAGRVNELFESLLSKHLIGLDKSMKRSVFDYIERIAL